MCVKDLSLRGLAYSTMAPGPCLHRLLTLALVGVTLAAEGTNASHGHSRPRCSAATFGCRARLCDLRSSNGNPCQLCACRTCRACLEADGTLAGHDLQHPAAFTRPALNRVAGKATGKMAGRGRRGRGRLNATHVGSRSEKKKRKRVADRRALKRAARNSTTHGANHTSDGERSMQILQIGTWLAHGIVVISLILLLPLLILMLRQQDDREREVPSAESPR